MAVNDLEPYYPEAEPSPGPISSAMESAPTEVPTVAPSTREVGGQELVSNRISDVLSKENTYVRDARARGVRTAARRGLQNTSIAAQAGEQGAISAALPIATSDAEAYRAAAAANQAETGAASRLSATLAGTAYSDRQRGEIAAAAAEAGFGYETGLQTQRGEIAAGAAEAGFGYETGLQTQRGEIAAGAAEAGFGYETGLQAQRGETEATLLAQRGEIELAAAEARFGYSTALQTQLGDIQASAVAAGFEYDTELLNRRAEIDQAMAAGQFDYNQILTQMDTDSRERIAQLQLDSQELSATNQDAALVVRGTLASIAAIVTTPGITAAEITRGTDIIMNQANSALTVMGSDLSDIFPESPPVVAEVAEAAEAAGVGGTQVTEVVAAPEQPMFTSHYSD